MATGELKNGKAYISERARIQEAILAIADADADDDGTAYHRGWVRFRKAMISCGWKPPRPRPRVVRRVVAIQLPLPWRQEATQ